MNPWGEFLFDHPPHVVPRSMWWQPKLWLPAAESAATALGLTLPVYDGTDFVSWLDEFRVANAGTWRQSGDPEVAEWVRWRHECLRPWRGSRELAPPPGGRWLADWGLRVFEKHPPDNRNWKQWVGHAAKARLNTERRRAWVFPPTTDFVLFDAWEHSFRKANRRPNEPLYAPLPEAPQDPGALARDVVGRLVCAHPGLGDFERCGRDELDRLLDQLDLPLLRPPPLLGLWGSQTTNTFDGWKALFVAMNDARAGDQPSIPWLVVQSFVHRDLQSPARFGAHVRAAFPDEDFEIPRLDGRQWHDWLNLWYGSTMRKPKLQRRPARVQAPAPRGPPRLTTSRLRFAWERVAEANAAAADADADWACQYLDLGWRWFAAILAGDSHMCWSISENMGAMRNERRNRDC